MTTHAPRRIAASPRQQPRDAMQPRSGAEPDATAVEVTERVRAAMED